MPIGHKVRKVLEAKRQAQEAAEIAKTLTVNEVLVPELVTLTTPDPAPVSVSPPVPPPPLPVPHEPQSEVTDTEMAFVEERKRKKGERLTHEEIAHVLYLAHQKRLTQVQIAKRMNCDQGTVSHILQAWAPREALAKAILRKGADTLATRVVKEANVAESIDVLTRLNVLDPAKSDKGGQSGVNVLVGINLADIMK